MNKKIVQTKKGEDIKLTLLSVYNCYIYIASFLLGCYIEVKYM